MFSARIPTALRPALRAGRWLAVGLALQALALPALATGPIRFDEPEFSPLEPVHAMVVRSLDGVRIAPLTFGFWLGGAPSLEARIGGDGPAISTYVSGQSIEGPARGLLTIDFGAEVTLAGFGFAFDVDSSLGDRVTVRAMGPEGEVAHAIFAARDDGLFSGNRVELGSPEPFTRLEVVFQTTGRRFVLDNLYYRLWGGPTTNHETMLRASGRGLQAAVDSAGRRVITWLEGGQVWAQLISRYGLPLSGVLRVSELPIAISAAAVSFDPLGGFTVAWTGGRKGVASDTRVMARLFAANGAPLGEPLTVSGALAEGITVAHLPSGEPVIFWEQNDTVRGRILHPDGELLAPSFSLGPGKQRAPAVAASPSGAFAVVWLQPEEGDGALETARASVYVRFYSGDAAVTRAIRVNEDVYGAPSAPAVAVDGRGDAIVVWQQQQDGTLDVFARQVTREGVFLGPVLQVNSLTVGDQGSPAVAANLSGDFSVAWESDPTPGGAKTEDRQVKVMSRSFNRLGQPVENDLTVAESPPGDWAGAPSVTLDEDNTVVVLFERRDASGEDQGIFSRRLENELSVFGCAEGSRTLCLRDGRFRVEVTWIDFAGALGTGTARRLSADTGSFWFFSPENLELVVKILDGTALNGHWWVFYGALSNVEYDLTISDLFTGRSRTYHNPMGHFASVGDTEALLEAAAGAETRVQVTDTSQLPASRQALLGDEAAAWSGALSALAFPAEASTLVGEGSPWFAAASRRLAQEASGGCVETTTALCVQSSRFQVEIDWEDFKGHAGAGRAVELTADSGYFWFFNPGNIEVVVKVLDGRDINGYFWVFYGALTNVEFELGVLDTLTGTYRIYRNELGQFASVGDTEAIEE